MKTTLSQITLDFKDFNRKIKLSNDGGELSSDSGQLLFKEKKGVLKMAVRQPTEKEMLIQDILNLTDEQAKELRKQLNECKKLLLPYEDEILTKEEEQALKESEKGNAKTYPYNEIFGKDGR